MPEENIFTKIGNLKKQIRQNYKAEIKGIFGSYARGNHAIHSDIDVLVEFYPSADLFDFVGLSQFLEEHLSCKVDIVPLNSIPEELKTSILREVIYL